MLGVHLLLTQSIKADFQITYKVVFVIRYGLHVIKEIKFLIACLRRSKLSIRFPNTYCLRDYLNGSYITKELLKCVDLYDS